MKKYFILSILGFISFGLVITFYLKSESKLAKSHEATLNILSGLRHAETNLEKDILRARNFLISSYDPIVFEVGELQRLCGESIATFKSNPTLSNLNSKYCDGILKKIENVERFKSKNAILKNSLYYVHQKSSQHVITVSQIKAKSAYRTFNYQLLRATLTYASIPTPEAKVSLQAVIAEAVKQGSLLQSNTPGIADSLSHAQIILSNKEELDSIIYDIVEHEKPEFGVDELTTEYLNHFRHSEATAETYRALLFGSSIMFFFLIIYGIQQLWRSARRLEKANQNLEQRVLERTHDLQNSQAIIIEQQQSLVASAKMSALGEMAGGVAHEINTPLAIISMRTEQLEECLEDNTFTKEDVVVTMRVVRKTTERIAKIVSGLRFFARDGSRAPFQDFPLVNIVDDTLSFCAERFSIHGVQVEFKERELFTQTVLSCRAVELSQVLLNLLNNSYDAVQGLDEKWIRIELGQSPEYVEISVTDSGKGIPKEVQDKFMQPFFTTKEVGKGTGLGLSISRGIIASHQGKLFVDNNSPNTKFTMLLPKKQSAQDRIAS